jgi:hypothetical protein
VSRIDEHPAPVPSGPPGERALLTDGTAVLVRPLTPLHHGTVADLHRRMPPEDRYLRFCTAGGMAADAVAELVVSERSVAVGTFLGDRPLGVAHHRRPVAGAVPVPTRR